MMLLVTAEAINAQGGKSSDLTLFTARNLYITGESIQAEIIADAKNTDFPLYVYCDLIGQDGHFLEGNKYKIIKQNTRIIIAIPDEFVSGNYLLRAYTRAMYTEPQNYAVQPLKIVNPYSEVVLPVPQKRDKQNLIAISASESAISKGVSLSINKRNSGRRQAVECSFKVDSNLFIPSSICLSVLSDSSFLPRLSDWQMQKPNVTIKPLEAKGLLLRGQVFSVKTKQAIADESIYLGLLGSRDLMTARSDSLGRFAVRMPDYYGRHELIISPEVDKGLVNIKLDKEFDTRPLFTDNHKFALSYSEQEVALNLARNRAITADFTTVVESTNADSIVANRVFYNQADDSIIIMEYVDLPNLSMYFTELLGDVHLHKRKGNYSMRINDANGIPLLLKPLLMVDFIPITDLQSIMKIDPKQLNRIEVVNSYYQKGELSFGGIVNFISNKDNFGDIDFPTNSLSINFDFLNKAEENRSEINHRPQNDSPIPDSRATIAFSPIPAKGKYLFYTSDVIGKYYIIIQMLDKKAKKHYFMYHFLVK